MNLLDLMIKIGVDDQATEKIGGVVGKAKSAAGTVAKAGAVMATATVAAVGATSTAFVNGVKSVSEYGDNVDKMSQKLGLSSEAFQKWDYVLSQSGVDINSMQTGLKTLTNQIDDAKNGSADAQARFEKLGISLEDLNNMSREEVFEAAITGFQGMADSTERAALANDLFGRSGQNLAPLFNQSAESTRELMQAAQDLGMVMSDESVKASAAFQDSLDTMQRTLEGAKNKLFGEFMPSVTTVMDGLTQILAGNAEEGVQLIGDGVSQMIEKITESLPAMLEASVQLIGALMEAIIENLPAIIEAFLEGVISLIDKLAENTDGMLETAIDLILKVMEAIIKATPRILEAMAKLTINLVKSLIDHIPDMLDAAGQLLGELLNAIGSFLGDMWDAGANLIQGFIDGIWANISGVGDAIMSGLGGAVDGALSFLGIASPSKLFKWIGDMSMEGMVEGIEETASEAERAMRSAAQGIYGAASGQVSLSSNLATSGGGAYGRMFTIQIGEMNVRDDADIERIAELLADKMRRSMTWNPSYSVA